MTVNFVNPHDVMFFDTDGEETVQVKGLFPIFDAPDTPLYQQKWQTTLPASFFDDLEGQPPAVGDYKRLCDMYYGRIPMDRRDMWHNHVNYYLNCILDVDRHIGAVLDALEASGQADDTIVIFTSDHGEQGGAHHLRQKGSVAFQESVNVPLVIADPRHRRGQVGCGRFPPRPGADDPGVRRPVRGRTAEALPAPERPRPLGRGPRSLVCRAAGSSASPGKGSLLTYDMIATIDAEWFVRNATKVFDAAAAAAGQEFHHGMEAFKGLVDEIGLPNLDAREMFRGIFDGRYKLVRYFGLGHYNLPAEVQQLLADNDVALYDLQSDPDEMDNLANPAHPRYDEALLSAMNQKLNALIAEEIGEDKAMFTPPETVSQVRGYAGRHATTVARAAVPPHPLLPGAKVPWFVFSASMAVAGVEMANRREAAPQIAKRRSGRPGGRFRGDPDGADLMTGTEPQGGVPVARPDDLVGGGRGSRTRASSSRRSSSPPGCSCATRRRSTRPTRS